MVFSDFAYGPGTHVRCDVCRDPEALQTPRHLSEVVFDSKSGSVVGTDEAAERAVTGFGFVRRGYQVLCSGCAAHLPEGLARSLFAELRHLDLCQSVGVGDERGHPVLIVYATRDPRARDPLPLTWEGLPVRVRVVGRVVPA